MSKRVGTKAKTKSNINSKEDLKEKRLAPAKTVQGREKQLINLAMDEAERMILEHKATSQLLTHFLKLGSTTEELAKEKLINENLLLKAKADRLESEARIEELYARAIQAMRAYGGHTAEDVEDD